MMTNSNQLIRLIKKYLIPDLQIMMERFFPVDGICYNGKMCIEVKAKNGFYHEVYITKNKYDEMMKYERSRYINLMRFPDSGTEVVFSFNLHKLPEPNWEWISNPDASNELYTGWKPTLMGKLHIKDAKNITNLIFNKK